MLPPRVRPSGATERRDLPPPELPGIGFELIARRSRSAAALAVGGIVLMGLGLWFIFLRPPLLPEDSRFIGTSLPTVQATVPGLLTWLRRVFWVLGGFMFTTGLLTAFLAVTSFRERRRGAVLMAALAGLTSIGWMATVNFLIASDFKWLLLAFTIPWGAALVLYAMEGVREPHPSSETSSSRRR